MKLSGVDETVSLELNIVGYQFPESTNEGWDSNWLMIEGKARLGNCEWSFKDPLMTTFEVEELIGWLKGPSRLPTKIFVEPNLKLTYLPPTLTVSLSHESTKLFDGKEVRLVFPLKGNDLATLAESLRLQLKKFPFRGDFNNT